MAKGWNRLETWIGLVVLAVGGVLAAVVGVHTYMSLTARPVHPDAAGVPSVAGAAPDSKWTAAVEQARQAVRAHIVEKNLPGVSVAVGADHTVVWAEGFGFADIEKRTPVSPSHRFRIGDVSIPLTAAAVGLLLEQSKLNLDDEIQKYVPEFPKEPWPVTLRQLMGHLAGTGNDGGDEGVLFSQHCERPAEGLEAFAGRALLSEPGTRFAYSRYGWILLSAAVEAASGEPFLSHLQKQIFDPLGMDRTMPDSASEIIADEATSYFPRYAADPRYGEDLTRDIDLSCYAGAGAFLSTPSDLVRFGRAINRGTLLQPATVRLLQTSQRLPSEEETGYGLGWDIETAALSGEQTRVIGYDGELRGGKVMSFTTFPGSGLVVAVTSNTSFADTSSLALKIAEAFAAQAGR
jgi:CubicO group peptidase (beta-lactamase class C family)